MLSSTPSQRAVSLRGPRTQDREYPGFDLQIYRLAKSAGIPAAPLPGNGDTIKLGSRLESINKDSSVPIDISEATWVEVNGLFETRQLGEVTVKGKEIPVKIYAVVDRSVGPRARRPVPPTTGC